MSPGPAGSTFRSAEPLWARWACFLKMQTVNTSPGTAAVPLTACAFVLPCLYEKRVGLQTELPEAWLTSSRPPDLASLLPGSWTMRRVSAQVPRAESSSAGLLSQSPLSLTCCSFWNIPPSAEGQKRGFLHNSLSASIPISYPYYFLGMCPHVISFLLRWEEQGKQKSGLSLPFSSHQWRARPRILFNGWAAVILECPALSLQQSTHWIGPYGDFTSRCIGYFPLSAKSPLGFF